MISKKPQLSFKNLSSDRNLNSQRRKSSKFTATDWKWMSWSIKQKFSVRVNIYWSVWYSAVWFFTLSWLLCNYFQQFCGRKLASFQCIFPGIVNFLLTISFSGKSALTIFKLFIRRVTNFMVYWFWQLFIQKQRTKVYSVS